MTLGACLIANDIPYEGMAKDIIDRRVKGQSWKQIGEELNIGSPSAARSQFTKLTGITDYKIKGDDLLKLVKGDLSSPVGSAVKPVGSTLKAGDGDLDVPSSAGKPPPPATPKVVEAVTSKKPAIPGNLKGNWRAKGQVWVNNHYSPSYAKSLFDQVDWNDIDEVYAFFKQHGLKITKAMKNLKAESNTWKLAQKLGTKKAVNVPSAPEPKSSIPDVTSGKFLKPKEPSVDDIPGVYRVEIRKLHQSGNGYQAIRNKMISQFGEDFSIDQIDRVVAKYVLDINQGDVWKALKAKSDSLALQKEMSRVVYDAIEKGISKKDVADHFGIPKALVDKIVEANGNWKKPYGQLLPEDPVNFEELPDYQMAISNAKVPSDIDPGKVEPGFGSGRGQTDQSRYPKATNERLAAMRRRRWETQSAYDRQSAESGIRSYTGSGYMRINGDLRSGSLNMTARKMDKGMYEVDEDFSVTRGMGVSGFGLGHMTEKQIIELIGKTVTDRGFLSTSTKPVFGNTVRLNIEVPKGARGHWAKPISMHSSEDEFILARGTRMMVLGMEQEKSTSVYGGTRWLVRVRVIV